MPIPEETDNIIYCAVTVTNLATWYYLRQKNKLLNFQDGYLAEVLPVNVHQFLT